MNLNCLRCGWAVSFETDTMGMAIESCGTCGFQVTVWASRAMRLAGEVPPQRPVRVAAPLVVAEPKHPITPRVLSAQPERVRSRFAGHGRGSMYDKDGQLDRLHDAFRRGLSIRSAAREVGCSHITSAKLYRILVAAGETFTCECGKPSTHRGWCSPRFNANTNAARMRILAALARGRRKQKGQRRPRKTPAEVRDSRNAYAQKWRAKNRERLSLKAIAKRAAKWGRRVVNDPVLGAVIELAEDAEPCRCGWRDCDLKCSRSAA